MYYNSEQPVFLTEPFSRPIVTSSTENAQAHKLYRVLNSSLFTNTPDIAFNLDHSLFSTQQRAQTILKKENKPVKRGVDYVLPLRDALVSTFKNFGDYTSLHGFHELYYAKSVTWKVIWFFVIAATIGLSIFQLTKSYQASLEQRTITTIQPLSSVPDYPSLKICYLHWLFWVKFENGMKLGFDKSSILYGLSYLTPVITEMSKSEMFNASVKFEAAMKANKFSNLMDFFNAISPDGPPGITLLVFNWTSWTKGLAPDELRLCYEMPNKTIHEGIAFMDHEDTNSQQTIELHYDFDYVIPQDFISLKEFDLYTYAYLKDLNINLRNDNNFTTKLKVSPLIKVDNVRAKAVMLDEFMYEVRIRISGKVHRWLDNSDRPCTQTINEHYDYCDHVCKWMEIGRMTNNTSCISIGGAQLFDVSDLNKICRFHIYSLPLYDVTPGIQPQGVRDVNRTGDNFISCVAEYCAHPCEEWIYDSSMALIPVPTAFAPFVYRTLINVQYPRSNQVLVLTELPAQTWESLIGEVGGLCGLWLGASVMSLLQLVYLCFCLQCDEKVAKAFDRSRRN